MSDPDITSLRLFVAMCEHQNISAAARQENIAPSAASKRIAQLAHSVKAPLFERRRRGVELTPAGRTLLEHAHTILYTLDRIQNDIDAEKGGIRGHVRMLVSQSVLAEELPADVAAFMRVEGNFNIKVDIEQMFSRDLLRTLHEGSTAIGICWDRNEQGGLATRPYRSDELVLAVHRDHPLASRESIRFAETLAYEHVGQRPGGSVYLQLQRAAATAGSQLVYRAIVASFETALSVVASNLAVSIIPKHLAQTRTELRAVPLVDPWARRDFILCFRDYDALEPAAQHMVDFLASAAGREG